jgi:hypothetical protein
MEPAPMIEWSREREMTADAESHSSETNVGSVGSMRQVAVPSGARECSTLAHVDYEDAFLVETVAIQGRTGEQWARAVLEGAPESTQRRLVRGWRALGLRLGPTRSDEYVLGWEVRRSGPDIVLLGSAGRFGLSGELLFEAQPNALLFATFLQLDNLAAHAIWRCIARHHRDVVGHLLGQAAAPHRSHP